MRKRIISSSSENVSSTNQNWLDLEPLVRVEITSEDVEHPNRVSTDTGQRVGLAGRPGWRANNPSSVRQAPENPANSFVVLRGSEGADTRIRITLVAKPWPVLQGDRATAV